jgi:hypothetical protein
MDHVVGGKFNLGKKIGSGSFGELYLGEFLSAYPLSASAENVSPPIVCLRKRDANYALLVFFSSRL